MEDASNERTFGHAADTGFDADRRRPATPVRVDFRSGRRGARRAIAPPSEPLVADIAAGGDDRALAVASRAESGVDAFSYLSVLLSISLGLAITQVLQGMRGLMHALSRVRMYAPALLWTALSLVVDVQSWWSEFGLRHHQSWTFLAFSVVIAHTICLYMIAALVLPDVDPAARVDLREHYYGHYRWFFAFVVLAALFGIGKDLALDARLPETRNLLCQVSFVVTCGIAALTRREWYHQALAPAAAILFAVYTALLFSQLD